MTDKDYPVDYVCSFIEPWGEQNFDCVHCKDRAAAIQKASQMKILLKKKKNDQFQFAKIKERPKITPFYIFTAFFVCL